MTPFMSGKLQCLDMEIEFKGISSYRCSVVSIATRLRAGRSWVRFLVGAINFSPMCRPILGPTQPLIQWVPGFSSNRESCRGVNLIDQLSLTLMSIVYRAVRRFPYVPVRRGQGKHNILLSFNIIERDSSFYERSFKLCKAPASFIMSVRACVCINSAPTGRIYVQLILGTL